MKKYQLIPILLCLSLYFLLKIFGSAEQHWFDLASCALIVIPLAISSTILFTLNIGPPTQSKRTQRHHELGNLNYHLKPKPLRLKPNAALYFE